MKEYIMSFFNAPVTNKIPTCICSVAGLHTYISTNPQLEELTRKVRAGLGDIGILLCKLFCSYFISIVRSVWT